MAFEQIILPLPPQEASSNHKGKYFGVTGPAIRAYRDRCAGEFRRAVQCGIIPDTLPYPITIHLDFYLCPMTRKSPPLVQYANQNAYFPKDCDNARASFKAGQDALPDAGIVPKDTADYVRSGHTLLHRGADAAGRTELLVMIEVCP